MDVICDKNDVHNQDEWLKLGGGGVEWDLMVLCSANNEDPDSLDLGVSLVQLRAITIIFIIIIREILGLYLLSAPKMVTTIKMRLLISG